MRLIDADALWMDIIHNMDYCEDILEFIEAQPTADAVNVVRCKNCEYREDEQPGMVYCPNIVGGWVDENWFCAGGERKETEDEAN